MASPDRREIEEFQRIDHHQLDHSWEILDCEQQGLITVHFHYRWTKDEQNEIIQRISDRYLQKDIPEETEQNKEQVKILKQWNVLRIEIISFFYKKLEP